MQIIFNNMDLNKNYVFFEINNLSRHKELPFRIWNRFKNISEYDLKVALWQGHNNTILVKDSI